MMKIIQMLFLSLVFCSCHKKNESTDTMLKDFFSDQEHVNKLTTLAIENGDTIAYQDLHCNYALDSRPEEILYCSIIMAHKYNFKEAYSNIFFDLTSYAKLGNVNKLDERTKFLSLYYLAISKEKGNTLADAEFNEIYGDSILQSSNFYLDKLKEIK